MVLHLVLHEPEIPPNTGNAIRLCANMGAQLHLIEPLGFEITDKRMRRAGLDYHERAVVHVHSDLDHFLRTVNPTRFLACETGVPQYYTQIAFASGDAILFGNETRGLPNTVLEPFALENRFSLPMRSGIRSLNLSNAVAIVAYEAWRQLGFMDLNIN